MPKKLLVVDDEVEICEFVRDVAEELGFDVAITTDPTEFRQQYIDTPPDVVIMDLMMPKADGIELLHQMWEAASGAQVIVMSGVDARLLMAARRLAESHNLRILAAIEKPVTVARLRDVLSRAARDEDVVSEASLRAAIETDQIAVYYQPKVSLKAETDWSVVGAEALVRWRHPTAGIIAPEGFISLAEQTGLIASLTERVFALAIVQAGKWRAAGFDLNIAVNLSPVLLNHFDQPDRMQRQASEAGIQTSDVTIEITESGAMADAVTTMEILTRFRIKGFNLSLDDFGTGYSSLVALHRMPFNEVKIDKTFILDSEDDPEAVKIIRSIAQLSQSIGVNLCGEGVETDRALALLRSVGCDTAQGHLISRPVPPDEFEALLRDPVRRRAAG
jgi:EAL domain-containing protein (putative c-di-GMP-specific phosphodiesterase class I)